MTRVKTVSAMLFVLVLGVAFAYSQSKKPLTNGDIIQMVKAGFTEQTIMDAIKANNTAFDTSVQGLLALKKAGVSQNLIDAMLAAEAHKKAPASGTAPSKTPSQSAKTPPANPNDPRSQHDPGIYWLSKGPSGQRLIRLDSTYYSKSKAGGFLVSGLTYGIHKAKWKAVLKGSKAALRVDEATPEFWFYFNEKPQGFGQASPLLGQATKPQEFTLVKLERKHKQRLMIVGQSGFYSVSSGIPSSEVLPVKVQQVEPGIYEVTPTKPLKPGEYCFVPPGGAVAFGTGGGQVFDFGIDPQR